MSGSLKAVLADLTSEINEMRVKVELSSNDDEIEEKFNPDIPPTQTPSTVDEIDIKYEDVDYHRNNANLYGSDVNVDENDLNQIRFDNLHCDRGCVTCLKLMKLLSAHVRATHAPPPFILIQNTELIDLLHFDPDPPGAHQSPSIAIGIKSEPVETTEEIECADEESETKGQLSHHEFESESANDSPASPHLTQNVSSQGLTKNNGRNDSKSNETKKKNLSSHKCDVCHKSFTTKTHLKVHKRIHNGEKPYKCTWCEKSFTQRSSLNVHIKLHTGEKPYACDLCEMRFIRYDGLSHHRAITHNYSGEKPNKCSVCDKSFSYKCSLTEHMRIHSGETFRCDVCGKAFSSTYHLTLHKRSHTGEKPFKCDECGKSFKVSSSLTVHKRKHTGERPYKCTVCENSFTTSNQMIRHRNRKH